MTYAFTTPEDLGFYRSALEGEDDRRFTEQQAAPGQPTPEDNEPEEPTP